MDPLPRLSAVSYLNTRPLVWGMLHGPQAEQVELQFDLPARCAEELGERRVVAGLVPVIEAQRMEMEPISDLCIACDGEVRSIFLLSKRPIREVRRVAMDLSSRTSVMLTRILLDEVYGIEPETVEMEPELTTMLGAADAALIIGDPALRIDPEGAGLHYWDLGAEWRRLTGLPMVFAMWSGRERDEALEEILEGSYAYGSERIHEILSAEAASRGIERRLAEQYLRRNIVYRLDDRSRAGLQLYLRAATEMEARLESQLGVMA